MKLFSGSANPTLTQEVAALLHTKTATSEVVRFENSEVRVAVPEEVKNEDCVIMQPIANPADTHLMELFFFCDALRRQEAKKVIGVIPYFGYARQDIQHRPGECVSANVIIRFFESIGFAKIYTIDIHDEATEGVFSIPYKNLSALPLLASAVKKYLKDEDMSSVAVTSPDQGGVERARRFGINFFESGDFSLAVIEKKRDLDHIHKSEALDLYGDVKDKTVVLVDDMTTSGGTLINATNLCLDRGAKRVVAAIVHHDFSPKAPAILQDSKIERFFTTNTIALKKEQAFPKLEEISVASLISEELKSIT